MIDSVVRDAIDQVLRFMRPGAVYACKVDDHAVIVIRISDDAGEIDPPGSEFFVACSDCLRVIGYVPFRRVYLAIHAHTEEGIATEGIRSALAGSRVRRSPAAGEVLPPEQRASWAKGRTEHDS